MPSPLGHVLGGFAAGWLVAGPSSDREAANVAGSRKRLPPRAVAFAALGVAADLDLLIGRHSQFTHSVGMALVVGLAAYAVLRYAPAAPRGPRSLPSARRAWLLSAAAAAAYGSHILLDWLAQDATPPWGIAALWPFSSSYYLSRLDVFWGISREPWRPGAAWHDVLAISRELLLLAPLAVGAWWVRRQGGRRVLPPVAVEDRQQLQPGAHLPADGESR